MLRDQDFRNSPDIVLLVEIELIFHRGAVYNLDTDVLENLKRSMSPLGVFKLAFVHVARPELEHIEAVTAMKDARIFCSFFPTLVCLDNTRQESLDRFEDLVRISDFVWGNQLLGQFPWPAKIPNAKRLLGSKSGLTNAMLRLNQNSLTVRSPEAFRRVFDDLNF